MISHDGRSITLILTRDRIVISATGTLSVQDAEVRIGDIEIESDSSQARLYSHPREVTLSQGFAGEFWVDIDRPFDAGIRPSIRGIIVSPIEVRQRLGAGSYVVPTLPDDFWNTYSPD